MSDALERLFAAGTTAAVEAVFAPPSAKTCDLPVGALVDMEQPFRLYTPAEAEAMRESIASHGVLQRILVRPLDAGRYQIISGRNRHNGALAAGLPEVPCEVMELTDDDAEALMIETNLNQRPKILPSERAWSYRRLIEIAKRQGQKIDFKEDGGSDCQKSRDALGAGDGLRGRQVQNYVALTNLTPPLLEKVDEEKLSIAAGVQLSYLSTESQRNVEDFFFSGRFGAISEQLATAIRTAGEKKKSLEKEDLLRLTTTPQKGSHHKVGSIPFKPLKKLFPREVTKKQVYDTTEAALKLYFDQGNSIITD